MLISYLPLLVADAMACHIIGRWFRVYWNYRKIYLLGEVAMAVMPLAENSKFESQGVGKSWTLLLRNQNFPASMLY
jgi:hypothetical protein